MNYRQLAANVIAQYHKAMDNMEFSVALQAVWTLISRANKYIDETEPWVLAKDPEKVNELNSVMVHLAESLRISAILLQPIMTESPKEIFRQLGLEPVEMSMSEIRFGEFPENKKVVSKGTPIFPRLDTEQEVEYIQMKMNEVTGKNAEDFTWDPVETELVSVKEKDIKYDVFDKVELKAR